MGAHINTFMRVHCQSAAPPGSSNEMKALMVEKRDVTFFGELSVFIPSGYTFLSVDVFASTFFVGLG